MRRNKQAEAVARRCSLKLLLLTILQYSLKSPCVEASLKSHEIQAVNAFHLKFKARLSWILGVLKIFSLEFNCVGNHFLEEFFSEIS